MLTMSRLFSSTEIYKEREYFKIKTKKKGMAMLFVFWPRTLAGKLGPTEMVCSPSFQRTREYRADSAGEMWSILPHGGR